MDKADAGRAARVFRKERIVLYLLSFVMGGCGIAYEYTLSKISSDLMGNSVQQWAVVIGLMMLFMGVGSDVQKYIKDKDILEKFVFIELLQGLVGGFGPIILLSLFGAHRDYFRLFQYLFIAVIGLIVGLEIPLITRINEKYTPELKINLGGILRMDYIGAFVGAVVWIFVLLEFFTLTQIAFVLGALNILVSGLAFLYFRTFSKRKIALGIVLAAGLLIVAAGFVKAPVWTYYAEQRLYLDRIVLSKTTKYQHIVMTQNRSGDLYLYINGNLQFSSVDEFIYHEFLVHPAMQIAVYRKNVLILGGGDGLALREVLKYSEVGSATLVDIDPEMTDFSRSNPLLAAMNDGSLQHDVVRSVSNTAIEDTGLAAVYLPDRTQFKGSEETAAAKVFTFNIDAVRFLEQVSGVFDVIIVDFPDPNSLELSKLYSRSFYEHLRKKLSKYGMVVQQSTSPYHAKEAFLCIGRTMESAGLAVVPFHQNVPTFGEWGWWIGGRDDSFSADSLRGALENLPQIPVRTKYVTAELIAGSLSFGKDVLQTENADINTVVNNVIFGYYTKAVEAAR